MPAFIGLSGTGCISIVSIIQDDPENGSCLGQSDVPWIGPSKLTSNWVIILRSSGQVAKVAKVRNGKKVDLMRKKVK